MIAQDLRPIRMAECEGFRNLLRYLEQAILYQGKNNSPWTSLKFEMCKEKLKKSLEDEAPSMALTTDIWTSIATEAYMTVTAHYTDPNWKLQNFVLDRNTFVPRKTYQC